MSISIKFKEVLVNGEWTFVSEYDTETINLKDWIRESARAAGWSGFAGMKEFIKTEFNCILFGHDNWSSLRFKSESDMNNMLKRAGLI